MHRPSSVPRSALGTSPVCDPAKVVVLPHAQALCPPARPASWEDIANVSRATETWNRSAGECRALCPGLPRSGPLHPAKLSPRRHTFCPLHSFFFLIYIFIFFTVTLVNKIQ